MIEVVRFKERENNTLRGFVTVRVTDIGLEIRNIMVHQKDERRWIGMPAKPYEKDGKTQYSYVTYFYDKNMGIEFQYSVLAALDKYLEKDKGEVPF
jgi:hypothetical protein